jgi:hypothetical protein
MDYTEVVGEYTDIEPRLVCVGIAEALPHPAVLINCDGELIHKNRKFSWLNLKWRNGSSVKRYIGKENYNATMATRTGDFNAFFLNKMPAASMKICGYFFIVFLSDFEANSTYITCIYDYIEDVVGGILSQLRHMKENSSDAQIEAACNSFGKKIKNYFSDKSIYGRNAKELVFGDNYTRRHRIEDVLKMLEMVAKDSPLGNKCNVSIKEHRSTKSFYVRCASRELGVILSMMLFSCIICSSSKKPNIEISLLKHREVEIGEITFSVKSKEKGKDINAIMDSKEYVDERSLYFKAIKTLAFKNLWAFKTYKIADKLCFSLTVIGERTTGLVFSDVALESTFLCMDYFKAFISDVLLKDET